MSAIICAASPKSVARATDMLARRVLQIEFALMLRHEMSAYFSRFEMSPSRVLNNRFSGTASRTISLFGIVGGAGHRPGWTPPVRLGGKTQTCALVCRSHVDRNQPSSPGFPVTQTFRISQMRECFSSIIASATLLLLLNLPTFAHGRVHENHLGRHHHRSIAHNAFGRHDRVLGHHAVSHSRFHHAYDSISVSRSCLNPQTRQLLDRVEAAFGPVQIVSTCRPGAVIAGTHHASMHRYGRAVDFNAPLGRKAAIVRWLAANNPGGTMTYANMGHIHMDVTGVRFRVGGGHGCRR
jgi:uncharacterized protein YcbK (DUF882 family)